MMKVDNHKRHSIKFLAFLIALFIIQGNDVNARIEADVESFLTLAPDTVVQGEPFAVTFQLTANSWKGGDRPSSGNGFCLRDYAFETIRSTPYKRLLINATYLTSQVGAVRLPTMRITVGDSIVESRPKVVYVKPHSDYGQEMTQAHNWLVAHGLSANDLCLSAIESNRYLLAFEDIPNHCFCMVARAARWPDVGNPVLAYSTESALRSGTNREIMMIMTRPYIEQLQAVEKQSAAATSQPPLLYHRKQKHVGPLLGRLEWGQQEPYNRSSPIRNGQKTVVGCVPLATLMIANYYQWPSQGQSHVYYKSVGDEVRKVDFSKLMPAWSSYQPCYQVNDQTQSLVNLSQTLTYLGVAIDANFSNDTTSASVGRIKQTLCNHMNYSGTIAYYQNLSEQQIESLIGRELDNRRPCIVGNGRHAFVCDGYDDDYLHFNLGWYGAFNGYYRMRICNYQYSPDVNRLPIKSIVCGIQPQRQEQSREVILEHAGTLTELLSEQEKESLTTLVIRGPLNSSDITLLRKMAGADLVPEFNSWQGGSLRHLNLENATIVADSISYLVYPAIKNWTYTLTRGNQKQTFSYDFKNMDEQQWDSFCERIGAQQKGVFYTRNDDNTYWANYQCQDNVIGERMFIDCTSLQTLVLPTTITRIENYAFSNCALLQHIHLPNSIEHIGKTPFFFCPSLEQITLPQGVKTEGVIYEKCSPALRLNQYSL